MYIISGKVVEKVMRNINFDDYESVQYFQRFLDMKGINKQLEKMGISEGDTVRIGEVEFEYIKQKPLFWELMKLWKKIRKESLISE